MLAMMVGKCFKKFILYFKIIPSILRRAQRAPQSPEAKESPKATSPLQELEVGSHRLLYLLVLFT